MKNLKDYETNRLDNNLNSIKEVYKLSNLQDVNTDLILSLCGKKIGSGSQRYVYEYNLDKKYVIKIEPNSTESNITEYMLWDEVKGLRGDLEWVKEWFAPILWMSPNGKILVMERTYEESKIRGKNLERPKEVPAFFSDLKYDNWGWIGNKFVCHDYGFLYKFIKYEKRMQKIKKGAWW